MMDFKQRQKRQKGQEKKLLLFLSFFLFFNLIFLLYASVSARANDYVAESKMELTNVEQTGYELGQAESNIEQAEIEPEQAESEPEQAESEPEQTEEEMEQTESESGQTESKAEQPEVKLYALSAVLLDATNNRILYEKNADQILPMASTTKIMTAIIALENGNPDDVVTVSKKAASMPKVHLGMREGEQYYLKDLMKSLMLESHNDSAVAIAEHIGQSVEGFAQMMNQKARDLGCSQTFFITPNGLDAEVDGKQHSTTAYELAKIAAYAIQNPEFDELIATRSASFCELTTQRSFTVNNKDRFLDMMTGAIGIKTGFTNKAGYCFVGAVERDGMKLVSVVLASGWPPHKNYKWVDTKAMMNYGIENYRYREIEQEEIPESLAVLDGIEDETELYMEKEDVSCLLADWDKVKAECEMKDCLTAPVQKNEIVGYEKIYINDEVYKVFPIKVKNSVGKYTYRYCLDKVLKCYILQEFLSQ